MNEKVNAAYFDLGMCPQGLYQRSQYSADHAHGVSEGDERSLYEDSSGNDGGVKEGHADPDSHPGGNTNSDTDSNARGEMKSWLPLIVFFLSVVIGLLFFGKAHADEFGSVADFFVDSSTRDTSLDGELYVSGGPFPAEPLLDPLQTTYSSLSWDRWDFGVGKNGKATIRIDQDGDIFFRGKWIGWDGNLAKEIKSYRKQLPHETN